MRQLSLIKGEGTTEKRLFPRFPFCTLTFKDDKENKHAFEVRDISHKGMQLALSDGEHKIVEKDLVSGSLHWLNLDMNIKGIVQWVFEGKIGVEFNQSSDFEKKLSDFLSIDNLVRGMKPLHNHREELDLPLSLKYWLKADSPCELFVWQDDGGHIVNFQILLLSHFIEWKSGEGLKSGETLNRSRKDSPLTHQDEFVVRYDVSLGVNRLELAYALVEKISEENLELVDRKFLLATLTT